MESPQPTAKDPAICAGPTKPASRKWRCAAKASFVIGLITGAIWLLFLIFCTFIFPHLNLSGNFAFTGNEVDPAKAMLATPLWRALLIMELTWMVNLAVNIVGLLLGVFTIRKMVTERWMAVAGAIINGVPVAIVFALILPALFGHGKP